MKIKASAVAVYSLSVGACVEYSTISISSLRLICICLLSFRSPISGNLKCKSRTDCCDWAWFVWNFRKKQSIAIRAAHTLYITLRVMCESESNYFCDAMKYFCYGVVKYFDL